MSHASQQIRDWFVTKLTNVSGLPSAVEGYPRQIAAGTTATIVSCANELVQRVTMDDPPTDERQLAVLVIVIAASLDAADALSLLAEEALAVATGFPGKTFEMSQREYQENVETDRDYVSITITYTATYYVARNNVESFK